MPPWINCARTSTCETSSHTPSPAAACSLSHFPGKASPIGELALPTGELGRRNDELGQPNGELGRGSCQVTVWIRPALSATPALCSSLSRPACSTANGSAPRCAVHVLTHRPQQPPTRWKSRSTWPTRSRTREVRGCWACGRGGRRGSRRGVPGPGHRTRPVAMSGSRRHRFGPDCRRCVGLRATRRGPRR
jgi:hypothetical protein